MGSARRLPRACGGVNGSGRVARPCAANIDLADVLAEEVEELYAIHPDKRIELGVIGDSQGVWDGQRLQQLLGNLVHNAIRYGARDAPARVVVICDVTQIRIEVRNSGPAIARTSLARIFDPLARATNMRTKATPAISD